LRKSDRERRGRGIRSKTTSKLLRMMMEGAPNQGRRTRKAAIAEYNRRSQESMAKKLRGECLYPTPSVYMVEASDPIPTEFALFMTELENAPCRPASKFDLSTLEPDSFYVEYVVDVRTFLVREWECYD